MFADKYFCKTIKLTPDLHLGGITVEIILWGKTQKDSTARSTPPRASASLGLRMHGAVRAVSHGYIPCSSAVLSLRSATVQLGKGCIKKTKQQQKKVLYIQT